MGGQKAGQVIQASRYTFLFRTRGTGEWTAGMEHVHGDPRGMSPTHALSLRLGAPDTLAGSVASSARKHAKS
eukprot:5832632-Prorocentrum_lima.AAC.1